jgi:hypothetical protein
LQCKFQTIYNRFHVKKFNHLLDILFLLRQVQGKEINEGIQRVSTKTLWPIFFTLRWTNPLYLKHDEVGIHQKTKVPHVIFLSIEIIIQCTIQLMVTRLFGSKTKWVGCFNNVAIIALNVWHKSFWIMPLVAYIIQPNYGTR